MATAPRQPKTAFLPAKIRRVFERLKDEPLLQDLTLVDGSAIALQIGQSPQRRPRLRGIRRAIARAPTGSIDTFDVVTRLAPVHERDVERHKSVMLGLIPLDKDDAGFEGIGVTHTPKDIHQFVAIQVSRYERQVTRQLLHDARTNGVTARKSDR